MNELKIIPHSEEAERGVLGSIMLKPDILDGIGLCREEFYDRRHQELFGQMDDMNRANVGMDAITIAEWLKDKNAIDKCGGYDYLIQIQNGTLVPSHSEHYAKIVTEKAEYRRHIDIGNKLCESAYKSEDGSDDAMVGLMEKVASADSEVPLDVLANQFIDDC